MKYPALLTFDAVLPLLEEFDTIIDARSEAEYAEDHIPGAINCPVLDNDERIRVGTLYKQVGAFEAKKVGAALVARNIATHINALFADKPREWKPLVYCWRGGNRSGSMAHILAKIGWPVMQLDGGYKEYRRHVNAALAELPSHFSYRVIGGPTGSGKSELLRTLAQQGAQVLDLEQLASHRGSVLGNIPAEPQPSQKAFESSIWQALRRFDPALPVFVESESKKVGNLRVPDALMEKMRSSPCIALSLSVADRVALLMREYAHFVADPSMLNRQLDCLLPLHGREKVGRWQAMAQSGTMPLLVGELLAQHYDPAYLRSIGKNFALFPNARKLALSDISVRSFQVAAQQLLASAALD
ncbi:tRNA 2-selenouridine(34) synthase MnmH [Janthinobacterium sp. 17J80-10]|uniref:tRNA 2-selenouridine(34) synthase MnmH n=1 Tax=Janthinobacterium sp. 17J80-10 TaxID=2497863 RepID=UPI0010054314|nr:tRNA 2-selenouridine(34) synthase MnmH [Janthinobacterium sp. 17J80-10]QAU34413.1 tRNA 2-selenouridine(34) synthase MnmH [Janthinobacterium sp. 17J80-10]